MSKSIKPILILMLIFLGFGLFSIAIAQETQDTKNIPPADCISWFDGCNTCEVINGEIGPCTKKGCKEYEKQRCLA